MNIFKTYIKIFLIAITSVISSCDPYCQIRLKNGLSNYGELRIITRLKGYQNQLLADTIILRHGQELNIGGCINCNEINDYEIHYDQILLDLGSVILEMDTKEEIIAYINDWGGPHDCVVKVINNQNILPDKEKESHF